MKYIICAVRDLKAGYYMDMFQVQREVEAERMFIMAVKNGKGPLGQYPNDFRVEKIGEWDNENGVLKNVK